MADESSISDNVRTLRDNFLTEEGSVEKACNDAPEVPHPTKNGTFKSQCEACLAKEDKELCVAELITSFMEENNSTTD